MTSVLDRIDKRVRRKKVPAFRPGDQVRVHARIVEGGRERIQVFEGVVLQRRGKGVGASFTVRKVSFGVGVERIFPLHSPRVEKVEVVRPGKVRRAKLFYLRERAQKAARLKERRERAARASVASAPDLTRGDAAEAASPRPSEVGAASAPTSD